MRISRSPQKGGFQSSTGGGPFPARASAPVIASRPDCPSFAMVCINSERGREVRGLHKALHSRVRDYYSASEQPQTQVVFPVDVESAQALLSAAGAYIA